MRSRSINTFDIIQHKNLISSLNRLIIEKSKKIVHLEKEESLKLKNLSQTLTISHQKKTLKSWPAKVPTVNKISGLAFDQNVTKNKPPVHTLQGS